MNNNKGFSLVELLAVIAIIGILTGLAIGAYGRYIDYSKKKAYQIMVDSSLSAMENYLLENPNKDEVYFDELVEKGYLKTVVDPSNSEGTCSGVVYLHENTDVNSIYDEGGLDLSDYKVSICCSSDSYTYSNNGKDRIKDKRCLVDNYNYQEIEKINVLAVEPNTTHHLSNWMNATAKDENGNDDTIGKGIIKVYPVTIDQFNANARAYLDNVGGTNEPADVVVFGFADCYGGKDLTVDSKAVLEEYMNNGANHVSVIFGHDTLIKAKSASCGGVHTNFNYFGKKYVNIEVEDFAETAEDAGKRYTKATIIRGGVFTEYPWNIGGKGTDINVASSHTSAQVAHGDVWMTFKDVKNRYSVFLSSTDYAAYTQTGHDPGSTTLAEKKIMANMIFYMYAKNEGLVRR